MLMFRCFTQARFTKNIQRQIHMLASSDSVLQPSSAQELESLLHKHHIDTSKWGTGEYKTVQDLFEEMEAVESTLEIQPTSRIAERVVRVLNLFIKRIDAGDSDEDFYLMEVFSR